MNEVDIVVALQGRALTRLPELEDSLRAAVKQIERGEADSLQFEVLRNGKTVQVNVALPLSAGLWNSLLAKLPDSSLHVDSILVQEFINQNELTTQIVAKDKNFILFEVVEQAANGSARS